MNIATFFREEQIDAFAVVSTGCLAEKDQEDVLQFFPQARSVIVFGKEVPATVYRMPKKGKTQGMLRIAEHLDEVAIRLADHMNDENIPAKAVPLYLPIKVVDGKVQGVVRLKHLAATGGLGSVGKSAILLNLRYGPRLFLSGVVSGLSIEEYDNEDRAGLHSGCSNLCSGCNRCAQVCPERAIGQAGVDVFGCRTIRAWVPPALIPAVKWLLGQTFLQKCAAPLAPYIARMATIRCSLCVTSCPAFAAKEGM